MTPSRRAIALGAVATAGLAAAHPGKTLAAGALGGGGFSVSGKPGPFVKQVASRNPGQGSGGTGAMGLASDAVNAGQYQAARLRMPQTEAKVAALLTGLDARWPYAKSQPLRVHILGVDYYNAYSLADGSIVVAFGLLDQAQSDDEVAFVLAHELGHVRLGHFARQAAAPSKARLVSRLGQAFLIGAALHAGGGGAVSAAMQGAASRADATNDFLHFLTNVTVEPGHTRAQEDEADCIGFDLSQAASFAADSASARVFDTVQADQQKRAVVTSDLNAQLKQDLGQAVSKGAAQAFLGGGFSPGGLGMGLLMGAGRMALAAGVANQPPQHRPPEERKRGVAQYSTDAYPEGAPLRDERHVWLTGVRGTSEYAQGKIAVESVNDAKTARGKGDYPTATAAIGKAAATSFRAAPLVLNEAARLRDDMGDAAGAGALFVRANASPDQTIDGYLDFGRMLYRTGQNDRAVTIVQEGTARFNNDPKPFLSLLIAVSKQSGRQDEMARYLQQCLAYGDQALAQDCRLAAGQGAQQHKSSPFGLPHL